MLASSALRLALLGSVAYVAGCGAARQVRTPEYQQLSAAVGRAWRLPDPVEPALDPVAQELAGRHPVEDYIRYGLTQNPTIQAARMLVESLANRVPQAASLEDPNFGVTVLPEPVQTASGEQNLLLTAGQKLPWLGKLATRADVAEQDVEVARAQLATAELAVVEKIKRAYYELYFVEQALHITEQDQKQLLLIEAIVDRQYRVKRSVSQQDLLRVQVEVSRLETELVTLRQQVLSARARLAGQLHVSPETELLAVEHLPAEALPRDLEALYRRAVAARPELHAALAAVQRDQRSADLARLDYFPDLTLGATWIDTSTSGISPVASGRDAVLIGMNVNVPIYRQRLRAGVREAETRAVASARVYDAIKDETMEDVKDLFAQAISKEELLVLFREDIIPKARQTLEQSIVAYQVSEVDFLQMIDNWRELLRFEITEKQLEAQLRQSLASLARVIGSYEATTP